MSRRERLLVRVAELVRRGQVERALAELEAHEAAAPGDDRVLLKTAELRIRLGRGGEAIEAFLATAAVHQQHGFQLRAIACLKQALRLDPARAEVLERLAEASMQAGLLRDAIGHFEALAEACRARGDAERAREALRRARSVDPDSISLMLQLGGELEEAGQPGEALALLRQAAEACRTGRPVSEWLVIAERIVALDEADRPLALLVARACLEARQPRRALKVLQRRYQLDARDLEVLELLAQAFGALGLVEKAIVCRQLVEEISRERTLPPRLVPPQAAPPRAAASAAAPTAPRPPPAPAERVAELQAQLDALVGAGQVVEAAHACVDAIGRFKADGLGEAAAAAVAALRRLDFGVGASAPAFGDLGLQAALLAPPGEELVPDAASELPGLAAVIDRHRAVLARSSIAVDAATRRDLGMAFFELRLFEAAVEEFTAAAAGAGPEHEAGCLVMIGRCHLQRGDFPQARDAARRALAAAPAASGPRAEAEALLAAVDEAERLFTT